MNKSKKLVFAFFISLAIMNSKCLLHNNVHASELTPNPQSSAYNSSENIFTKYGYKGQCTWFTYGRVLEKLGIGENTISNTEFELISEKDFGVYYRFLTPCRK